MEGKNVVNQKEKDPTGLNDDGQSGQRRPLSPTANADVKKRP